MGGVTPQYSAFGGSVGAPGGAAGGDGISAAASGERLSGGLFAAFGTGGYSDEPPLLEGEMSYYSVDHTGFLIDNFRIGN